MYLAYEYCSLHQIWFILNSWKHGSCHSKFISINIMPCLQRQVKFSFYCHRDKPIISRFFFPHNWHCSSLRYKRYLHLLPSNHILNFLWSDIMVKFAFQCIWFSSFHLIDPQGKRDIKALQPSVHSSFYILPLTVKSDVPRSKILNFLNGIEYFYTIT